MKFLRLWPLLFLSVLPSLGAQGEFESLFPGRPVLELRVQGTKTFLAAWKNSKAGKVMTDEAMAQVVALVTDSAAWKSVWTDATPRSLEIWGLVGGLGDLLAQSDLGAHVAVGMTGVKQGKMDGWMICRLGGERQALLGFAKLLEETILESKPSVAGKREVLSEERVLYRAEKSNATWTLPFLHEGTLYLYLSTDWERDHGAQTKYGHASLLRDRKEPFAMAVRLGAFLSESLAQARPGPNEAALLESLGVEGLGQVDVLLDLKKDRLVQEIRLDVPEKGLLVDLVRGLFPREGRAMDLLRHIPEGADAADLGTIDVGKTYKGIRSFADRILAAQRMGDIETLFEQKFGFSLVKGLLQPLDGRFLSFYAMGLDTTTPETVIQVDAGTTCVSLGVKDGAAFQKSVDKMIRKMGMHVSRKKVPYLGFDLYRFKFMGLFDVYYGLVGEFFVTAFGAAPAGLIHKVVDRQISIAAGEPGFVPDAYLKEQLALVPQSQSALRVLDLMSTIGTIAHSLSPAGQGSGSEIGGLKTSLFQALANDLVPLLRKNGVGKLVTTVSRNRKSVRLITVW